MSIEEVETMLDHAYLWTSLKPKRAKTCLIETTVIWDVSIMLAGSNLNSHMHLNDFVFHNKLVWLSSKLGSTISPVKLLNPLKMKI